MRILDRRGFLGAAAGGGAVLATGLAAPAVAQATPIVLYNGQHRQTTEAAVAAFTRATGIPVTIRQGESSQLSSQLREEGANSPADFFFSEQSPPMAALDDRDLLSPASAEAVSQIPAAYVSEKRTWIGTSLRTRVIAYNKSMLPEAELPRSILDVAQPAWRGKVGYVVRDGFEEQVMAIAKLHGRDGALAWLRGLKEQGRRYNGNGAAMLAVENGEIATALINNYYWFGVAKEKGAENMRSALYYVPQGDAGALVNVSPAAVLRTSKRPQEAQRLLAFLVGEDAQRAIVAAYAEYPVRPGIVSPFALKPLSEIGTSMTPAEIGSAQLAVQLMRESQIV